MSLGPPPPSATIQMHSINRAVATAPPPGPSAVITRQSTSIGGGGGIGISDPATAAAYMDVNGTYLCTAYNPRCFLLQKVMK